ncbi:integrase core domain-containing protein [uncultured Jannaschia sp.]|uniref:integrase core domain-containing protein n=1 Tax=uncultured Jannaschia sp. TaxID=293347 RepID=UPI003413CA3E
MSSPAAPRGKGYCDRSKLRGELRNGEIFDPPVEPRAVIEGWRVHINTVGPHTSLDDRSPAPEAVEWPPRGTRSPPPRVIRSGTETCQAPRPKPDHPIGASHYPDGACLNYSDSRNSTTPLNFIRPDK